MSLSKMKDRICSQRGREMAVLVVAQAPIDAAVLAAMDYLEQTLGYPFTRSSVGVSFFVPRNKLPGVELAARLAGDGVTMQWAGENILSIRTTRAKQDYNAVLHAVVDTVAADVSSKMVDKISKEVLCP